MKAYLKNPNLYYVVVPVAAALWVLFVMMVSLPAAGRKWDKCRGDYDKAQDLIARIAAIDPDRLTRANAVSGGKFDYSIAVEEVAKLVKIPSSNYSLTARKPVHSGGKDKQNADVTINVVDIETLARFISQMLLRWSDIECDLLSIDRLPAGKNAWKATMKFTHAPK
jgi:hypothetical protein